MRETAWRPAASLRARIAPTEVDPWRQRHLRGEVHDENAFALGGISAHAGLFSSAADLSRLARMYLNHGRLDGVQVLDSATIARFTSRPDSPLSNRALGWEKPNGSNSAGRRMSAAAFGHTGFTGTSFWVDPANDVFVILLTNRVNPTRENRKIGGVRIAVADAVMGALQGCAENATLLECPGSGR
jgi:CubicO group peptidase (beta-lactamase class C family)